MADSIPSFGIYLHWPFCQSRCPYCDFNAYAAVDYKMDEWEEAYLRQLDFSARETGGRVCESVFFGGGTPSLMRPSTVAAIMERISRHWKLASDAEITLEANPSSSEAEKFAGFWRAGVNRISIGVQSLRRDGLAKLGRLHSVEESRAAFEAAAKSFERVSIDLIYGRQHQSLRDWQVELREAMQWGAEHLSLYQLTIEPGTAFGSRLKAGGLDGLPGDELAADMQTAAAEICGQSGYRRYEVSNFARPNCESRHNLLYWRSQDFLGIGPGAHGRITVSGRRAATETVLSPAEWLRQVYESGSGENRRCWLSTEEQASEYLMMSLRLAEGTDLRRLQALSGSTLDAERLERFQSDRLVKISGGRLTATERGSLVLNSIVSELQP